MAIRVLDFTGTLSKERFRTTLDGTAYEFVYAYNFRKQRWFFDLLDDAGNELLVGIPILCNYNLLGNYQHIVGVPVGRLAAINIIDDGVAPTRNTLGSDVLVLYEDAK